MKKRICLILAFLLGMTLLLTACNETPEPPIDPPGSTETPETPDPYEAITQEIKATFMHFRARDTFSEDDLTLEFYGKFDEYYVLTIDGPWEYPTMESELLIGGVYFNSPNFAVYHDGVLYSIRYALNDYPIYSNLTSIQAAHREKHASLYTEHDRLTSEIQTAYAARYGYSESEIEYVSYLGIFRDTYVVNISTHHEGDIYATGSCEVTVDGVTLSYMGGSTISVYHKGEIYPLQEAFDNGYITHYHLMSAQNYQQRGLAYPDRRDDVTQEINAVYDEQNSSHQDYFAVGYYGEFDGVYVVLIPKLVEGDAVVDLIVDGVTFTFPTTNVFTVYHDGALYTVQEAFDSGLLTHADLLTTKRNWDFRSYSYR